jgi:hypothetical protein
LISVLAHFISISFHFRLVEVFDRKFVDRSRSDFTFQVFNIQIYGMELNWDITAFNRDRINMPQLALHLMRQYPDQEPGDQNLYIELLGSGFQSGSHVHMRRQVTRVYLVVRSDCAFDCPAVVQSESHFHSEIGNSLQKRRDVSVPDQFFG